MEREHINFLPEGKGEMERGNKKKFRLLFVIAGVMLGMFVLYALLPTDASNDPHAYNQITLEPKKPEGFLKRLTIAVFTKEKQLVGQEDDRINVLLLGMGGSGHDGPYLTDTIIIASVQPSTRDIALISIPRDLFVDIPHHGWDKINTANSIGEKERPSWGGATTAETIEKNFDIPIHYYARVDFQAFEEIIDAVGGITVTVDRAFADHMYPAENDEYQTVSFHAGTQTMDGKTALIYARSRHGSNGEGSDFARAKRQQNMLAALKKKLLSYSTMLNPVRIHDILESLNTHVTTNMEFGDMMAFVRLVRDWQTESIQTLVLDTSQNGFLREGYTTGGAYILKPKDDTFTAIQEAIQHIFEENTHAKTSAPPQQTLPVSPDESNAVIEIQNGTWSLGLAARVKKRLEDRGFVISHIGNTAMRPVATSGIYATAKGTFDDTARTLQEELHIPIKEEIPEDIATATSTNILIILGEDTKE